MTHGVFSIQYPVHYVLTLLPDWWSSVQCMYASAGVVGGMFLCSRLEVPILNQAQGSASSLPLLKPFQKQLYYSSQAHDTEEESRDSDVPIVIQGIDPVSTWCLKTYHTGGRIGSTLSSTGIVLHQPLSKFIYRIMSNLILNVYLERHGSTVWYELCKYVHVMLRPSFFSTHMHGWSSINGTVVWSV